jgi:hypothetical protein
LTPFWSYSKARGIDAQEAGEAAVGKAWGRGESMDELSGGKDEVHKQENMRIKMIEGDAATMEECPPGIACRTAPTRCWRKKVEAVLGARCECRVSLRQWPLWTTGAMNQGADELS